MLATGSELGFEWIFFKNWDDRGSLERSLPVVNWDLSGFFQKLGWSGFLRTLATGSELGFELIFSKIGMIGALERSLPVVSVLRGSDGRSTLPKIDSVLTGATVAPC